MHGFNLFQMIDKHLTRERIPDFRNPHLYPSEASVIDTDGVVHGACLRSVYYRLTQTHKTNPPNARSEYIFAMGNMIEAFIIQQCKEVGIWVDDHIKWYNPEYNVSGELDLVLRHPVEVDKVVIGEIKSFYGYNATAEIMGNRSNPGFPKIDQFLQAFTYVDWFREVAAGVKMIYFARDSVKRREFNIELHHDYVERDEQIIERCYPVVDGLIYNKFTLEDIYARYREVWNYYISRELPPRDYKLYYTIEEMEERIAAGLVAKTNLAGFQRNPNNLKFRKGSWRCGYCSYRDYCWEFQHLSNEDQRVFILEGDEVTIETEVGVAV